MHPTGNVSPSNKNKSNDIVPSNSPHKSSFGFARRLVSKISHGKSPKVPSLPQNPATFPDKLERTVRPHHGRDIVTELKITQTTYLNDLRLANGRIHEIETRLKDPDFNDAIHHKLASYNYDHNTRLNLTDITTLKALLDKATKDATEIENLMLSNAYDQIPKKIAEQKDSYANYALEYDLFIEQLGNFLDQLNEKEKFYPLDKPLSTLLQEPLQCLNRYQELLKEIDSTSSEKAKTAIAQVNARLENLKEPHMKEIEAYRAHTIQNLLYAVEGIKTEVKKSFEKISPVIIKTQINSDFKTNLQNELDKHSLTLKEMSRSVDLYYRNSELLEKVCKLLQKGELEKAIEEIENNQKLIAESMQQIGVNKKFQQFFNELQENQSNEPSLKTVVQARAFHTEPTQLVSALTNLALSYATYTIQSDYSYKVINDLENRIRNVAIKANTSLNAMKKADNTEEQFEKWIANEKSIKDNWNNIISTYEKIKEEDYYKDNAEFRRHIDQMLGKAYLYNLKLLANTSKYLGSDSLRSLRSHYKQEPHAKDAFKRSVNTQLNFLKTLDAEVSPREKKLSPQLEAAIRKNAQYILKEPL